MRFVKINWPLLLLWVCLTSTAPFIFFSWPGHPYKVLTFLCLLIMSIQVGMRSKAQIFDFKILLVIVTQIAYYLIISYYHNDFSNLNLCVQLLSLFIIICYINGFIGFTKFVKSYIYVILAMGIGGTITFFLHALIGIKPLFTVEYSASGTSYFLGLTTTNVYFDVANIRLIRYSGFFDEPGTFALFSIFAIILNRIYFKNKIFERGLIFVTIFTMSLAFYFILFVFFIFFYINKSNLKYLLLILIAIGFSYKFISDNTSNDTVNKIYEFTFKRFEINESGLAENNRSELSDHDSQVFFDHPVLGTGWANGDVYGSNFFSVFARYGIFGSVFYYAFILYFAFQILLMEGKYRFFYLKILCLILINFYHRPEMSSVFTLLIFVSIIYYIKNESTANSLTPIENSTISVI